MVKQKMNSAEGFTIIELIIALALLGIVLAVAYMFFFFGQSSFARGEERAIAQQAVRTGSMYITSEVRYADNLTLTGTYPANYDQFNYIYSDGTSIIHQTSSEQIKILDGAIDGIDYDLSFNEAVTDVYSSYSVLLQFNLSAEDIYALESNVLVLNIVLPEKFSNEMNEGQQAPVIKYTKPVSP